MVYLRFLPLLNRVDAVPRDLLYNSSASTIARKHNVRNISGTIGSDLEWPTLTNDVCPLVTVPLGMVASWSRTNGSKALYNTLLTIKLTCIVSSWPLLLHLPVYHVIWCKLSCLYFTCMSFYKSHLVNMFSTTFFSKWQSSCAISTKQWIVKYAYFSVYKIDVSCMGKIAMSIM